MKPSGDEFHSLILQLLAYSRLVKKKKFNPIKFLQSHSVKGGRSEKLPTLSLGACESRYPARPGQASLIRPIRLGGRDFDAWGIVCERPVSTEN